MTFSDVLQLELQVLGQWMLVASAVAQHGLLIGAGLILAAFVWWLFRVHDDPDWPFWNALRAVFLLAGLVMLAVSFVLLVRGYVLLMPISK